MTTEELIRLLQLNDPEGYHEVVYDSCEGKPCVSLDQVRFEETSVESWSNGKLKVKKLLVVVIS